MSESKIPQISNQQKQQNPIVLFINEETCAITEATSMYYIDSGSEIYAAEHFDFPAAALPFWLLLRLVLVSRHSDFLSV